MTSKARKQLEEYDIEGAGPFDLAVVLFGYTRQNSDDESEQLRVVEGVLTRWRRALEAKTAPELVTKNKKVAAAIKSAAEALLMVSEDLDGKT